MLNNIVKAALYIQHHGVIEKCGTGLHAISTEACIKQRQYIMKRFSITADQFHEAFSLAEELVKNEKLLILLTNASMEDGSAEIEMDEEV